MPFWRRRRERGPAGRDAGGLAEPIVDPEAVEPGWEPDPADFEDAPTAPELALDVLTPSEIDSMTPVPADAEAEATTPADLDPEVPSADCAGGRARASPHPPPVPSRSRRPNPRPLPRSIPPRSSRSPPPHTLDDGLERTRGGFVSQLRGYLGSADGPDRGTRSRRR